MKLYLFLSPAENVALEMARRIIIAEKRTQIPKRRTQEMVIIVKNFETSKWLSVKVPTVILWWYGHYNYIASDIDDKII